MGCFFEVLTEQFIIFFYDIILLGNFPVGNVSRCNWGIKSGAPSASELDIRRGRAILDS